jgi:predicted permease
MLKQCLRSLAKDWHFSGMVLISLSLGMASACLMFSLFDACLLRALPVENPADLYAVQVSKGGSSASQVPSQVWTELNHSSSAFRAVCAFSRRMAYVDTGENERLLVQYVTGNYFEVLGVSAQNGRLFATADADRVDTQPVVLSYRYWSQRFGSAHDVIGRQLYVDGVAYTIIGVTDPHFFGTDPGVSPDLTVLHRYDRRPQLVWMVGRLREGALPWAQAEVQGAVDGWAHQAGADRDKTRPLRAVVQPAFRGWGDLLAQKHYDQLGFLLAASLLLLLITSFNSSYLCLSRFARRQRDFGVRLAMGATMWETARPIIVECSLLSAGAAILGVIVTGWLHRFALELLVGQELAGFWSFQPSGQFVAFAAMACLISGLAAGLLPLKALRNADPQQLLTFPSYTQRAAMGTGLADFSLLAQVAFSMVLVFVSGLLLTSYDNLRNVDTGFRADNVLVATADPTRSRSGKMPAEILCRRMQQQLGTLAGISLVSFTAHGVLGRSPFTMRVWSDREPGGEGNSVAFDIVGPRFFETMGSRILAGREFSEQDTVGGEHVALVNESFVRRFCGGSVLDALRLRIRPGSGPQQNRIVGVVADVRQDTVRQPAPPTVYFPLFQQEGPERVTAVIRTKTDPALMAQAVQRSMRSVDTSVPVSDIKTLKAEVAESVRRERSIAFCSLAYAMAALLLSCVGIYGLLAYSVTSRYKEIGIRMALGATRRSLLWNSIKVPVCVIMAGILSGAAVSSFLRKYLQSLVFGLEPTNPRLLALTAIALLLFTVPAVLLPVSRVFRVNPSDAIRSS